MPQSIGEQVQSAIHIRPLEPSEWEAFRHLRLCALKAAPGSFAASFDDEVRRLPEEWCSEMGAPTHQVFALFDGEALIGITAAFTWRGDPTGQTAVLAMSFILPQYRGQGLSRLLYESRLAWIRDRPKFRRVIVSHRASNEASRRANQKHGFVFTGRESHVWPDGQTEDEVFYELKI